jgi:hypothetical protein
MEMQRGRLRFPSLCSAPDVISSRVAYLRLSTCDVNLFGHRREGNTKWAKEGPTISIRRRCRSLRTEKRKEKNGQNKET